MDEESDVEYLIVPPQKRSKTETRKKFSPSKYGEHTTKRLDEVQDEEHECMEFATLSDGRTILLSEYIWNINKDGSTDKYDHPFLPNHFAKVPGYDLVICGMTYYTYSLQALSLGVFTLPDLVLTSTINISINQLTGYAKEMCADNTSVYGIGRVLISTNKFLYLVDVTSEGQATVTSMLDKYACEAIHGSDPDSVTRRTSGALMPEKLLLYHDLCGNPIALIGSEEGRVVFVSMSGPQCIPNSVYSHVATGRNYCDNNIKMGDMSREQVKEYYPEIDPTSYLLKPKTVIPLRVLHALQLDNGSSRSRSNFYITSMAIWQPTSGEGKKLITMGSDGDLAISNIEIGTLFSHDSLPYKKFQVCEPKKTKSLLVSVYGDTAYTFSRLITHGTFWDLSKEFPLNKVKETKDLSEYDTFMFVRFIRICACFSDQGILAFYCSNYDGPRYVTLIRPSDDD